MVSCRTGPHPLPQVVSIATHVNEHKRKAEEVSALLMLQSRLHGVEDEIGSPLIAKAGRRLVHEGTLVSTQGPYLISMKVLYLFGFCLSILLG